MLSSSITPSAGRKATGPHQRSVLRIDQPVVRSAHDRSVPDVPSAAVLGVATNSTPGSTRHGGQAEIPGGLEPPVGIERCVHSSRCAPRLPECSAENRTQRPILQGARKGRGVVAEAGAVRVDGSAVSLATSVREARTATIDRGISKGSPAQRSEFAGEHVHQAAGAARPPRSRRRSRCANSVNGPAAPAVRVDDHHQRHDLGSARSRATNPGRYASAILVEEGFEEQIIARLVGVGTRTTARSASAGSSTTSPSRAASSAVSSSGVHLHSSPPMAAPAGGSRPRSQ